jgi:hypothetical protein
MARARAAPGHRVSRALAAVPQDPQSAAEVLLEALGTLQRPGGGGRGAGRTVRIQVSDGEIAGECELITAQAAALAQVIRVSRSR